MTAVPFAPGEKDELIRDLLTSAKAGDLNRVKAITTENTNSTSKPGQQKQSTHLPLTACDRNSLEQAIHRAAAGNSIEVLKYIISQSPSLVNHALDDNGQTALFHAAFEGKLEAVQFLVENAKAIISKKDKFGRLPIDLARSQGHVLVMNYLSTAKDWGKTCCGCC